MNRTQRPLVIALLTAVIYAVFVFALWNARGRDISRFIVLGNDVDAQHLPPGVTVLPGTGYDGTAFYRLALDPFTHEQVAYGIGLDMPAYRQQRIAYPLIVWFLSSGWPWAIPWMLVIVNVAAVAAIGGIGAAYARMAGLHAAWGLLFSLYPGFLYSVSRDLTEPLACAFALGALLALTMRRDRAAAGLLTAAVLTRETFLLVALAAAIVWFIDRQRRRESVVPPVVFIVPFAVFVVWQAILAAAWGRLPLAYATSKFTWPLVDYIRVLVQSSSLRRLHRLHFAEAAYIGAGVCCTLIALRRSRAGMTFKLSWLAYLGIALFVKQVWDEDVAFMRILSDLHITGMAIVVWDKPTLRRTMLIIGCMVWYYLASHLIKFP